ncbi:MAG TPA: alpha/beta hydrolase [Candidatus Omnitrophota bacterium]|nr:alpha/beta hydrolase [Candidatus Omnitrophota bacterium]HPT07699.1 alpha/beta hydrolase [Candidatus Omnitrophota bacterium]
MPQVKIGDISLYYEVQGKGAPLLLIAGLGSDVASWALVTKKLASKFEVIIFDNRGCGRSELGKKECTVSQMADDALKFLGNLKISKAHILGHSMGGFIAQEIAIRHPERVDRLILESTSAVSSERNNMLFKKLYVQLVKEGHSEAWFKRWTEWLFAPETLANSSFINAFVKNSLTYCHLQSADGFKAQIKAIASFDLQDEISGIKAKTLVVEGTYDMLITPEEAQVLARDIPYSSFCLLDGVGHCIHFEDPRLFVNTVLDFLNAV